MKTLINLVKTWMLYGLLVVCYLQPSQTSSQVTPTQASARSIRSGITPLNGALLQQKESRWSSNPFSLLRVDIMELKRLVNCGYFEARDHKGCWSSRLHPSYWQARDYIEQAYSQRYEVYLLRIEKTPCYYEKNDQGKTICSGKSVRVTPDEVRELFCAKTVVIEWLNGYCQDHKQAEALHDAIIQKFGTLRGFQGVDPDKPK